MPIDDGPNGPDGDKGPNKELETRILVWTLIAYPGRMELIHYMDNNEVAVMNVVPGGRVKFENTGITLRVEETK